MARKTLIVRRSVRRYGRNCTALIAVLVMLALSALGAPNATAASGNADFVGTWNGASGGIFAILTQNASGACTGTGVYPMTACQVTGTHFTFTLTTQVGDRTYNSVNEGTISGDSISAEFTDNFGHVDVTYTATRTPVTLAASFTVTPASTTPGQYQFVSTTPVPNGDALDYAWDFADGSTGVGVAITHTFAKPGTFAATLTVTDVNGHKSVATQNVKVAAPTLSASLGFLDASGKPVSSVTPQAGDVIRVRLTVSATDAGVGSISGITFTGDPLTATPSGAVSIAGPAPALPKNLSLKPGDSQSFDYSVTAVSPAVVHLSSTLTGTDESGATVTGTPGIASFAVSSLQVVLSLNPANYTEDEDASGPKPVDVTLTETITNLTDAAVTDVNLRSLDPERNKSGELLAVTQKSGPVPDSISGYPLAPLAAGASEKVTAVFTVKDDGEIEFRSLVTGAGSDASTLRGFGTTKLSAKPKYFLGLTSTVTKPSGGLLPAGSPIVITGTVRNLTDSATLDVGPLLAEVEGNAGAQGLAYNGTGVDPEDLVFPGTLTLDPGESKDFTLKILTSYSDPTGAGDAARSGGTSATATFTPWADVTLDDGTTFTTKDDQVLSTDEDLTHQVSIDDSIPLPVTSDAALAGGVMYGIGQGVWNLAAGMVSGVVNFDKISYTTLAAVANYQSQVWDSFTPKQRDDFSRSQAAWIVPVLMAESKLAAKGVGVLTDNAEKFVDQWMTRAANDWAIGNQAQVAADYSNAGTQALGQAIMGADAIHSIGTATSELLGGLAKDSSAAAKALTVTQAKLQAKLATIVGGLSDDESIENLGAFLDQLASGSELDPAEVSELFGINPAELQELQSIATQYRFLLTVRSRQASSIDWIEHFNAMVKPEALKIKTVSMLDARLGYAESEVGSLVFKEPEPLVQWRKGGGAISDYVQSYLEQQGFVEGTGDYDDALNRIATRISEWNKYDATYKGYAKQGWIETTYNASGNAVTTSAGKLAQKQLTGFALSPIDPANLDAGYIVKLYNPKVGRFVPVTGDIDAIAFTHLDGTALTEPEHAELLLRIRNSALLQGQHGESATYVAGGLDFIEDQFKPGEAALQIAPQGVPPRVVRFNKARSVWKSAENYRLGWDGGDVQTSGSPAASAVFTVDSRTLAVPEASALLPGAQALPGDGSTQGANVGRCSMSYSTAPSALPLEMGPNGQLEQVSGTMLSPSSWQSVCFSDGPVVDLSIRPSTSVSVTTGSGKSELPVATGPSDASDNPATGFAVGQQVTIDAGTPNAESGVISGFGSIIFSHPLRFSHQAGAVVVMTGAHPATEAALANTGEPGNPALVIVGISALLLGSAACAAGRRRPVIA